MNVLVTGATGYVGAAVVRALRKRGHTVVAALRNDVARGRLQSPVDRCVVGDIATASDWLPNIGHVDGVIHTAATFDEDMAAADAAFVSAVSDWAASTASKRPRALPFVYTGGLWLYGPVSDRTAVEGSPFNPPPHFAYMLEQRARLFGDSHLRTSVVHPAMVWDEDGGVVASFIDDARAGRAPRVTGDLATRWPLVHRDDLADLFVLAIEAGEAGADYHGVAEAGVAVGLVAAAIARSFHAPPPVRRRIESAVREIAPWAECLAYDQTMDAPLTRRVLNWQPTRSDILANFKPRGQPQPRRWRRTLNAFR